MLEMCHYRHSLIRGFGWHCCCYSCFHLRVNLFRRFTSVKLVRKKREMMEISEEKVCLWWQQKIGPNVPRKEQEQRSRSRPIWRVRWMSSWASGFHFFDDGMAAAASNSLVSKLLSWPLLVGDSKTSSQVRKKHQQWTEQHAAIRPLASFVWCVDPPKPKVLVQGSACSEPAFATEGGPKLLPAVQHWRTRDHFAGTNTAWWGGQNFTGENRVGKTERFVVTTIWLVMTFHWRLLNGSVTQNSWAT